MTIDRLLRHLPAPWYKRLFRLTHPVSLGALRTTVPPRSHWGSIRGLPIDRFYIEAFLAEHRDVISGRVLEVGGADYSRRFGSDVQQVDVLDVDAANRAATIVADLEHADDVPDGAFDCFILTQTLQLMFDTPACLRHCRRILKPGGSVLATVPCSSRLETAYGDTVKDYWRFTAASCEVLFGREFGSENITVTPYGNILTMIGFLAGLAAEDLQRRELEVQDPLYPLIIAVRAVNRP